MNFNILTEIEPAVFLEVYLRARDDFARGVDHRNPSLSRRNRISPWGYEVYELDDNLAGAFLEGEGCYGTSPLILDDADLTLNIPYTFLGCCNITCNSFRHYGLCRSKLHIKKNKFHIIRGAAI